MPVTSDKTERPGGAYCSLILLSVLQMYRMMTLKESLGDSGVDVGIRILDIELTRASESRRGHCQVGSLIEGRLLKVAEVFKDQAQLDGNQARECVNVESEPDCETDLVEQITKVGVSDPVVCEWKCHRSTGWGVTLGMGRLISPRVHIDGGGRHLGLSAHRILGLNSVPRVWLFAN